jgi:hypothetical protein
MIVLQPGQITLTASSAGSGIAMLSSLRPEDIARSV